jgi:hypothetical protein
MQSYVIALSPLLLALTALFVVFPIGLHYAKLESDQRRARVAKLEAFRVSVASVERQSQWIYAPAGTMLTVGITQPPQSQTAPSSTQAPEQPLPKAA